MLKFKENIVYVFLASAFIGLGISFGKIYAFHLVFFVSLLVFPFKKVKYFFLNKPAFITVFPCFNVSFLFAFYVLVTKLILFNSVFRIPVFWSSYNLHHIF